MSFKASIWAGRFDPEMAGLPDPRELVAEAAFTAVLARFADQDESGQLVPARQPGWSRDGRKRVLGYITGEYVIYHRTGFVEVVFAGVEPRIDGFLAASVRELGCRLLDANNWEWVTDWFLGLADRAQRHVAPGTSSDGGA